MSLEDLSITKRWPTTNKLRIVVFEINISPGYDFLMEGSFTFISSESPPPSRGAKARAEL